MSGLENIGSAKLVTGTATKISGGDLVLQQGTVSRVGTSLQSLPQTTTLRGEVVNQDANGTTRIQTPRGDVELRLDRPLPQGQKVDIQLSSGTPPRDAIVQTRLEAPRPQTPVQQTPQPTIPTTPNAQSAPTAPSTPNTSYQSVDALRQTIQQANTTAYPNAQQGQALRALALPPFLQTPSGLATLNTQPPLPINTQGQIPSALALGSLFSNGVSLSSTPAITTPLSALHVFQGNRLQVSSPLLPLTGIKASPANTLAAKTNGQNTAIPALSTSSMNSLNSLFSASNQPSHMMQITAIKTPTAMMGGQQASLITQPIQAGQIHAGVTGFMTQQGFPILQTITATSDIPVFFTLQTKTALPTGTQITLSPTSTGTPAAQQAMQWPAFQDSLDFLLQNMGNASQSHNLLNVFPQPEISARQFTATALLFFAAARGGDISQFMGSLADQALRATPQGRNIVGKLLDDIKQSTGKLASSDPAAPTSIAGSSEWRGTTLPLLFGLEVHKINLWTKEFGDNEDEAASSEQHDRNKRFIVDVTLSRMGQVQLDGLTQPSLRRLDLIVKTQHHFTTPVQNHLQTLWINAMHQVDMTGTLDFETL